jgi:hypothetical protein
MDSTVALGISGLLVLVICVKQFSFVLMEVMMKLPRPLTTSLLLLIPVGFYMKNMVYSSLVSLVMTVYLIQDIWKPYLSSDARRLFLESGRDQTRFDPSKSIDLQFANHSVTHDSPNMLVNSTDASPLLIYPPSAETLEEMCG